MVKHNQLDLHGVQHSDVDRIVENFIFMNQELVPLKIICGNSQRMIDLVIAVIEKHKLADVVTNQYGIIDIYKI
jgi:hypothetical protein